MVKGNTIATKKKDEILVKEKEAIEDTISYPGYNKKHQNPLVGGWISCNNCQTSRNWIIATEMVSTRCFVITTKPSSHHNMLVILFHFECKMKNLQFAKNNIGP